MIGVRWQDIHRIDKHLSILRDDVIQLFKDYRVWALAIALLT